MWTWIKEVFFLWISNGYSMIYVNFGSIGDPLRQNLTLQFCRNGNKDVSILNETDINLDQIHQIKMIGWTPSFSLLEIATQKDYFFCFIRVLKVSLRLTLIQKGVLCLLRLLPLMTGFFVLMPLQDIVPGNNCIGGVSLKDYKIIWKTKMGEVKTI